MGCASSTPVVQPSSTKPAPAEAEVEVLEPYPENGKKLRTDATLLDVYTVGKTIGEGGFSKVRLVTHKETGEQYACKVMPLPRPGKKLNEHFTTRSAILAEIDVLLDLDHPNIVGLKEYFVWSNRVYLIMELLQGGELLDALVHRGSYGEADARTVFVQLLRGVQYLHSMGIVHRDLKLDNLLLVEPGDISGVKIADFGFAKKHPRGTDTQLLMMKTICGTPEYMAPEIIKGTSSVKFKGTFQPYGPACDLWSCGIILYMLLSGAPPFSSDSQPRLFRAIVAGAFDFRDPLWRSVSPEAKDLISKLLVVDPAKRCSCEQALAHPWITSAAEAATAELEAPDLLALTVPGRHGAALYQAPLQERIAAALQAAAAGDTSSVASLMGRESYSSLAGDSPSSSHSASQWLALAAAGSPLLDRLSMSNFSGELTPAQLEAAKAALEAAEQAEQAAGARA